MNHCIMISIQLLLISQYLGDTEGKGNFRRAGKVSPSKIIFFTDDHEPLLPRPTFSPNVKLQPPRFRTPTATGPPKKFTPIPSSPPPPDKKHSVIQTTMSSTMRASNTSPRTTTIRTSTSISTSSPSTILNNSGSHPRKSVLVEPILEGSFYVPFKMMNINNFSRSI